MHGKTHAILKVIKEVVTYLDRRNIYPA